MESGFGLAIVVCCLKLGLSILWLDRQCWKRFLLETSLSQRLHRMGNPRSMECVEFAGCGRFSMLHVLGASWGLSVVIWLDWDLLLRFSCSWVFSPMSSCCWLIETWYGCVGGSSCPRWFRGPWEIASVSIRKTGPGFVWTSRFFWNWDLANIHWRGSRLCVSLFLHSRFRFRLWWVVRDDALWWLLFWWQKCEVFFVFWADTWFVEEYIITVDDEGVSFQDAVKGFAIF